jgi:hypothetical protein
MKDAVQVLWVNSRPGIFHHYQYIIGRIGRRPYPQRLSASFCELHGFDGVCDEVGDNLLELNPIGDNWLKPRG